MAKINRRWHEQNRMPRSATERQRIAWHVEHVANCGCRPIPKGVVAIMRTRGISAPTKVAKWGTKTKKRFSKDILAALDTSKILGLRAGTQPHRFIGIWVVVTNGRVFVRSWSIKRQGWYQTFLAEPQGTIQIAGREIRVRARKVRGERLLTAIDRAYRTKYPTPGSRKFVAGFARGRRRATTTELVPW